MHQAGTLRSLLQKRSHSLGGHLCGETLWSHRLTPPGWSISQAGWWWNRLDDLYILQTPDCLLLLRLRGDICTTWHRGFTIALCTDTHSSLCTSRFQLVAAETVNSTHSSHKTKFMNPPSSQQMAIRTEQQMCYFHMIFEILCTCGWLNSPLSWCRSGCSTQQPPPKHYPLANKTATERG